MTAVPRGRRSCSKRSGFGNMRLAFDEQRRPSDVRPRASQTGPRAASRLVARGVSSYIVQHAGGWRTASMMQRYAHLDPATIRAAVALLTLPDNPEEQSAGIAEGQ